MSPTRPGRVLIVEDDEELSSLIVELLGADHIAAVAVESGLAAVAFLESQPLPSLILLDLGMPGMDGVEFRRRQLEHLAWSRIPVIVLSADHAAGIKARAMGVEGFLTKPVNPRSLLTLIARWTS
ncbi:MAG: response regulator [Kofleriaceae bacterium]